MAPLIFFSIRGIFFLLEMQSKQRDERQKESYPLVHFSNITTAMTWATVKPGVKIPSHPPGNRKPSNLSHHLLPPKHISRKQLEVEVELNCRHSEWQDDLPCCAIILVPTRGNSSVKLIQGLHWISVSSKLGQQISPIVSWLFRAWLGHVFWWSISAINHKWEIPWPHTVTLLLLWTIPLALTLVVWQHIALILYWHADIQLG